LYNILIKKSSDLARRRSSQQHCIPRYVCRCAYIILAIPPSFPSTYRQPCFYWKMPAICGCNLLTQN